MPPRGTMMPGFLLFGPGRLSSAPHRTEGEKLSRLVKPRQMPPSRPARVTHRAATNAAAIVPMRRSRSVYEKRMAKDGNPKPSGTRK